MCRRRVHHNRATTARSRDAGLGGAHLSPTVARLPCGTREGDPSRGPYQLHLLALDLLGGTLDSVAGALGAGGGIGRTS